MKKLHVIPVMMLIVLGMVLAGCGGQAAEAPVADAPAEGGGVTFAITGNVDQELSWSEEEIRAMDTMDAEYTNSEGEIDTYTGASMNALLDLATPAEGATTLVLVADDGYETEVDLAEVQACSNCILSFRSKGGFTSVLPDFPKNTMVKGIVEIRVQ